MQDGDVGYDQCSGKPAGLRDFEADHRLRFVAFSFEIFVGAMQGHMADTKVRKMSNRPYFCSNRNASQTKSVVSSKTGKTGHVRSVHRTAERRTQHPPGNIQIHRHLLQGFVDGQRNSWDEITYEHSHLGDLPMADGVYNARFERPAVFFE